MKMGSWATHFSYYNTTELTQSADMVYALSEGNLFSVSKEYEDIKTYSKINYLNDGEISHVEFSDANNLLLIAYSNSNIDILKGNRTINISDLKRKETPNKEINNITFYGQYAYLSCGFGIVVVDLAKEEIADTYIIGANGDYTAIDNVRIVNEHIFALTRNGILYTELNNNNLSNFENWKSFAFPEGVSSVLDMDGFGSDLLIISDDNKIFKFSGSHWEIINDEHSYTRINVTGNNIIFYSNDYFRHIENRNEKQFGWIAGIQDITYSVSQDCYWAILKNSDGQGVLTKIKYTENESLVLSPFIPNGPYSDNVNFIKYRNGKILTGSGGPRDNPENTPGVVQVFENNKWSVIRGKDLPADLTAAIGSFVDVLDAEIDPKDPKRMYVASWRSLFEFYDNVFVKHYNSSNSTLTHQPPNINRVLLNGLRFDQDNNLWMLCMESRNVINVKKADNTWESLYYGKIDNQATLKEIFISKNGYKWVILPRSGSAGVFVINDNGTPFVARDDKAIMHNTFNESTSSGMLSLSPNIIRCIAEDQNNVIWIGTDIGPILIPNQNDVFNSNFTVDRIKITREDNPNLADYLLENERINAIVIDGGNRKWIGTASSGLYLLSPNGQETINHFTTDNSPLTSNEIKDIALNDETGEVFIATLSDIFTFKSDASNGSSSYSNVYAYPNPVYENYTGLITVKGLMDKSVVKIADLQGNLIYQGYSNGGTFTWNGTNLTGQRVATGVYLVFSALDDGSEKVVTKIAFIN
jgi:hypothetical protein